MDTDAGLIRLTTVLAHSSGEWMSSDWPVCRIGETAAPHRLGAALTYARRYALFTLVGIAGEDDLDAPDFPAATLDEATQPPLRSSPHGIRTNGATSSSGYKGRTRATYVIAKPILPADESAVLRDRLLADIANLASADGMLAWACANLPTKNTLTATDARLVEEAFRARMSSVVDRQDDTPERSNSDPVRSGAAAQDDGASGAAARLKPRRVRSEPHRDFVSSQPCLVCGRQPSDAHHLRFTQPTALGRKVSDEFTVPVCRVHHRELHGVGDERSWWEKLKIDPTEVARRLWQQTSGVPGQHRRDVAATPISDGGTL